MRNIPNSESPEKLASLPSVKVAIAKDVRDGLITRFAAAIRALSAFDLVQVAVESNKTGSHLDENRTQCLWKCAVAVNW
jgi:hypothetical protein